jgi:hypothetical protein
MVVTAPLVKGVLFVKDALVFVSDEVGELYVGGDVVPTE